jgi:XTP/dITP diphosphohydrolase
MIKKLAFVTTNTGKFEEVKRWLTYFEPSIELEQVALDLPEIQSLDVQEIALDKAQQAWAVLQRPLLIDDGGIYLEKYYNFPGPLTKYVYKGIGFEGFWRLAYDDPRAYFLSCLVYSDGPTSYHLFEGICKGHIIENKDVVITHTQLPFTHIFVPEGHEKVFSELKLTPHEEHFHHRVVAIKKFLQWLNAQK